jgi:glucokinase
MTGFPRLLADVGGTHARFGWRTDAHAPLTDVATCASKDHPRLQDAIGHYLTQHGKPTPHSAAIGIATALTGDRVEMTNHPWSFSISAMQREMGWQRLEVLNDFTALALALPLLGADELVKIGGGTQLPGSPLALLGAGTGLGVSGLLRSGPGQPWMALQGEGGHVTLAPSTDREEAVLRHLRQRFGHVSGERAVSGQGLVALYEAVCALNGVAAHALNPAAITTTALQGGEAHAECREALNLFCAFLGTLAADLALTLGALGGVFIGGGIVPRLGPWFAGSPFRQRFEDKGRFSSYLAGIATLVIDAKVSPALRGADQALDA